MIGNDEDNALIVQLPKKEQHSALWLVNGTVGNARTASGVRCRLYRLADSNLGYYDPSLRSAEKTARVGMRTRRCEFTFFLKQSEYVHLLFS